MNKKLNKVMILTLAGLMGISPTATFARGMGEYEQGIYTYYDQQRENLQEQGQPLSSTWFVKDLLEWSPEKDVNAKYNVSTTPLAERVTGYKVNEKTSDKAEIMMLADMYPSTSGMPSQGNETFFTYMFSYWQYIDQLVMWGGSADEGIILSPSADVIDVAHKNGVKAYGTVFFPPSVYGGKQQWVKEFVVKDEQGNFPVADQLIKVAQYYGFDGWFINQETSGVGRETATAMREMIAYMKEKAPEVEIIWYDSMVPSGNVSWQGAVNDQNAYMLKDDNGNDLAEYMFVDFRWYPASLERSVKYCEEKEIDKYSRIFMGIEAAQAIDANNNFSRIKSDMDKLWPSAQEDFYTSIGLFCPSHTRKSLTFEEYMEKDINLWSGNQKDPSNTIGEWPGIANYINEKTVVTATPFITHFNLGNGHEFYKAGQSVKKGDWQNRSLQDILPTWRWIAESEGEALVPDFDWEDAYYGGNSISIKGKLSPENGTHVKLYKTALPIKDSTQLELTYKSNNEQIQNTMMKVGVSFEENPHEYEFIEVEVGAPGMWQTVNVDLSAYAGKTLAGLSMKFESETTIDNYQMNLGKLAVIDTPNTAISEIENVELVGKEFFGNGLSAALRMTWDRVEQAKFYEVYKIGENGEKELVGATTNNAYYVQEFDRVGKEATSTIQVVAVNDNYNRSQGTSVALEWPGYPAPEAGFKVDKVIYRPGEVLEVTNTTSVTGETFKWTLTQPSGKTIKSGDKNPAFTLQEEGWYGLKLVASNEEGASEYTEKRLVYVTSQDIKESNKALGSTATANHEVNWSERATGAVDGTLKTKWCATNPSNGQHWLQLDLGSVQELYKFVIKHASEGGEAAGMNTQEYSIQISEDGKEWKTVVVEIDNKDGISQHSIVPTLARYVKLNITKAIQGNLGAARIYEFEAWGYDPIETNAEIRIDSVDTVEAGESVEVTVGVEGGEEAVYSQDLTIKYDPERFSLLGYEAVGDTMIAGVESDQAGELRVLLATEGGALATDVLKLNLRALDVGETTASPIQVTDAAFGFVDAGLGTSESVAVGDRQKEINIIPAEIELDKVALEIAIVEAEKVSVEAVVGDEIGQYPQGAKDQLDVAIRVAKEVLVTGQTQEVIDEATYTLNQAVQSFKASVNKAGDGDINEDGSVDVADLALVAYYYLAKVGDSNWDQAQQVDMNKDGVINIVDLVHVAGKILEK